MNHPQKELVNVTGRRRVPSYEKHSDSIICLYSFQFEKPHFMNEKVSYVFDPVVHAYFFFIS